MTFVFFWFFFSVQVAHLKRGIYGWHLEGLPFEGNYDSAGIGRTPSVVRHLTSFASNSMQPIAN